MQYNLDQIEAEPLVLTIGGKEYRVERMSTGRVLALDKYSKAIQAEKTIAGQYEQSIKLVRELAPSVPEDVLRTLDMAKFQRLTEVCTAYHYGESASTKGDSGNPGTAPKGGDGQG